MFSTVLFDLDGTLADTAPDLAGALNRVRVMDGMLPLPMTALRPYTSQGVRGLLKAGYGIDPDHPRYDSLAETFLTLYETHLCVDTRLFDGMETLLARLEAVGIRWGVVTNKRERFTLPLMRALRLVDRAASIVSGDTTPEAKPSPLPLLHACNEVGCAPASCLYVGDDHRDVVAGKAAGMTTVAVRFGYLGDGEPIEAWGADYIADTPDALADYIFGKRS